MKVPSEIVLNRSDVGDPSVIEKMAEEYNVEIKIRIPYSERLLRAYSEGRLERVVDLI